MIDRLMFASLKCRWVGIFLWLACTLDTHPAPVWHWSNPLPHGNDVTAMGYFNGLVIQAADSGQLYTSDDLQVWLPEQTGTTNILQAITTLGNRLIVTGANGTVLYSDDGINYTCTNLGTTDWLVAAAASSNLVVTVGDEAAIYTSTNGADWIRQAAPPGVGENWLRGVTWNGSVWVTVGEGGYIATSANGTTWTQRPVPGFARDLNYVGWLDTPNSTNGFTTPAFLAVSDLGGVVISTNNGATWSVETDFITTNSLYAMLGNNDSRLVAGQNELQLAPADTNGISWNNQIGILPDTAADWQYFAALWETNLTSGTYLVSGEAGLTEAGVQTNSAYLWNDLVSSSRTWLWSVTTNAGLYVAVGDMATIMTSDDGVDWTIEAIPETNSVSTTNTVFFGVGGNSNQLIAVGNGGTIVLSTNSLVTVVTTNTDGTLATNTVSTIGVVWNPVPPPTTNDLHGVEFFNGDYYVSGGNGTILQSANGVDWTRLSTPTTAYLSGLAVYAGGMVATGNNGTILTSADGTTWTSQTSGTTNWLYHVRYLDGLLITVGDNGTILTSANGTAWTEQNSTTTNFLNDVTMVTNQFFVVGDNGTVLSGTNGTTWTNAGIITLESLYGATTQSGQLVVVGLGGAILRGQIVPVLTPVNFLDFYSTGSEALFLVGGAVDQEFTLDSSTNLTQWTTGPLLDLYDSSGTLLFYETLPTNAPPKQYYRTTLVVPP